MGKRLLYEKHFTTSIKIKSGKFKQHHLTVAPLINNRIGHLVKYDMRHFMPSLNSMCKVEILLQVNSYNKGGKSQSALFLDLMVW